MEHLTMAEQMGPVGYAMFLAFIGASAFAFAALGVMVVKDTFFDN